MESSKKLHGEQGCQIFTAVLPKKVFCHIFPLIHHNFHSNWPRNLILKTIPKFLGTRNLMESSKNYTFKRVAKFLQRCCQKRAFCHIFLNYVITFLLIGLGT